MVSHGPTYGLCALWEHAHRVRFSLALHGLALDQSDPTSTGSFAAPSVICPARTHQMWMARATSPNSSAAMFVRVRSYTAMIGVVPWVS